MQILYATEPTPGQINEDFVITGPTWAVVLDGASPALGIDTGCIHDVPWFVQHLGTELARLLTLSPTDPLDNALARAITATRRLHERTCDLSNPDSPSATVVAVRKRGGALDYLTLADSPLIVDNDGQVRAITDDRTAHLADYSHEGVRAARNSPNGFYVASTTPDAAYNAVRGSLPTTTVRRAALLSDGAARLVERYALMDWRQLLDLLTTDGPVGLIQSTRQVELAETDADRATRRGKTHDDATAVLITQLDGN
ncbi:MAG: protein phosphatase 2C domain-containing protein [Solirubrobacteraceae bacterium]